jgi:hypothetical protein
VCLPSHYMRMKNDETICDCDVASR